MPASPRAPADKQQAPVAAKNAKEMAKDSSDSLLGKLNASPSASACVTSSPVFTPHPFAHLPTSSFLSSVPGAPSITMPWINRPTFGPGSAIPDLLPGVLPFSPAIAEYSSRLKSLASRDAPAAHPSLTSSALPSAFSPPSQQQHKMKQNGVTSSNASHVTEERRDVIGGKHCDKCSKSFKFESNLVLHKRTHSGVFPTIFLSPHLFLSTYPPKHYILGTCHAKILILCTF